MSFIKKVEEAISKNHFTWLKHQLFYWGQNVRLYSIQKDEYSRVYGTSSGNLEENYVEVCCIIVNTDVIPIGPASAGSFTTGNLYTDSEAEVQPGQIVEILSQDGRSRRFEIKKKESYGITTNVFHRWEIVSVGD